MKRGGMSKHTVRETLLGLALALLAVASLSAPKTDDPTKSKDDCETGCARRQLTSWLSCGAWASRLLRCVRPWRRYEPVLGTDDER